MPIYEYKCSCGATFDTVQGMNEPKLTKCNKKIHDCKQDGTLTRLISKPLILSDDIGRGSKRMTDRDLYKELDIDK
jgi:putative FmdB family regulatory protein|tara:strand:+ start:135 stop:362 length:228 start_codon:yes stop_codon:yes gene_type:complete